MSFPTDASDFGTSRSGIGKLTKVIPWSFASCDSLSSCSDRSSEGSNNETTVLTPDDATPTSHPQANLLHAVSQPKLACHAARIDVDSSVTENKLRFSIPRSSGTCLDCSGSQGIPLPGHDCRDGDRPSRLKLAGNQWLGPNLVLGRAVTARVLANAHTLCRRVLGHLPQT